MEMKRKFRFIAGVLVFCILFIGYFGLFGADSVFAGLESIVWWKSYRIRMRQSGRMRMGIVVWFACRGDCECQ